MLWIWVSECVNNSDGSDGKGRSKALTEVERTSRTLDGKTYSEIGF